MSKNDENIRTSPSEVNVIDLNDNVTPNNKEINVDFVDCATTNETDAKKLSEEIWQIIESQSKNGGKQSKKPLNNNSGVVRVFVSSTFVDCHAERNVLVKEVKNRYIFLLYVENFFFL